MSPNPFSEYHLIDLITGESHGGFCDLKAARDWARGEGLSAWDIWHGGRRVEYHNPFVDPLKEAAE